MGAELPSGQSPLAPTRAIFYDVLVN